MKIYIALLFAALICVLACATKFLPLSEPSMALQPPAQAVPFVERMHQITFDGARAGEGYFSLDGRYMVFQSERELGNPFYQIYLTDLKDNITRRISPGVGKTSCSWIAPDNKHILFSSTHADQGLKEKAAAEYQRRKNPKSKYAWNFDDAYDIYESDMTGHHLKNLTHSPGYDAEGSYSPDGKWIAFASNRAAYVEPMNEEQKALFAKDPSNMMDIYIMRANGTQVKRLTTSPGYDGGPFFSPDGQRLTWRHFSVDGRTAEVYTMNVDGTDQKQLTHLQAMSWAPFYHPSGDYLIFASNKLGNQNFELYIVDVAGQQEPVRVTDIAGFDGLPVFTPDGGNLVWTHANEKGEAQLYRADWNDALARKALKLEPLVPRAQTMSKGFTPEDARRWLEYLASEHMAGRATGSAEEKEYLTTITQAFAEMGLQSLGPEYLQKYEFTAGVELDEVNQLELQLESVTSRPAVAGDWVPLSFSKNGHFVSAPVVFAGYGIVAPAQGALKEYNSYGALEVKDNWVVVFSGLPEGVSNERRFQLHQHSNLLNKERVARSRGARGLVVIEDGVTPSRDMHLTFEGRGEDVGLPVIRLSAKLADQIFSTGKTSRKEWTTQLAKGETPNFVFSKVSLQTDIHLRLKKSTAFNAVGVLKVPGATATVMIGAHGDHLGRGEQGSSLARGRPGLIHYGADDNASGVTGVMELAHDLAGKVKRKELVLKQNIAFAVWTGEEIGILGSANFVKSDSRPKISAYLNMDMIGRYREQLLVQGVGSAREWKTLIEKANLREPLNVKIQEDSYLPTDSLAFYLAEIPTLAFFTGSHAEYHTPEDKADLINYPGLIQTLGLVERIGIALALANKTAVTYQKVAASGRAPPGHGQGMRLYLGTIPDYTHEGGGGVMISGTSKDSPAEKAGVKAGDLIVELGGIKIQNLNDYVYCLQALKANQRIAMRVLRRGAEKSLEITPILRAR